MEPPLNLDYKDFQETKIKISYPIQQICNLAPKFKEKDAKIYIEKKLTKIERPLGSPIDVALGVLMYTNKKDKLQSIPVIAKVNPDIYRNPIAHISFFYEQELYEFISQELLKIGRAPNFGGYIGDGHCDTKEVSNFIDGEEAKDNKDNFVLMTQFAGQQSLIEFLSDPIIVSNDDIVCSILFQCSFICLLLEHFRIQYNNTSITDIRIETLNKPVSLCYNINDQRYIIDTKHIVYIYNWSSSYFIIEHSNNSILNSQSAYFVANHLIHKRDFCVIMNSITHNKESKLLRDMNKYVQDTYNNSLLCTIQTFEPFYRYLDVSPTNKFFCYGGKGFQHNNLNKSYSYVVSCIANTPELSTYLNLCIPLIDNAMHVKYNECKGIQFAYPYNSFKKAQSFSFIRYCSKLDSLQALLSTLSNTELKQLTIVAETNINNLFELLHKYTRNIEELTVISTIPHNNNTRDLEFIKQLKQLKYVGVTMEKHIKYFKNDQRFRLHLKTINLNNIHLCSSFNGSLEKMHELLNIQTLEEVVMYVKALYLLFTLRDTMKQFEKKKINNPSVSRYYNYQLFAACLYYIFERDEILAQEIKDFFYCYDSMVTVMSVAHINVANIGTPIDYIYYIMYGLAYRQIKPSHDAFKRACFEVIQVWFKGGAHMSLKDVTIKALRNSASAYVKFIE